MISQTGMYVRWYISTCTNAPMTQSTHHHPIPLGACSYNYKWSLQNDVLMSRLGLSAEGTGFRSSTPLSSRNNIYTLPNPHGTQPHMVIVVNMHLLYSNEANGVLTYIPTTLLEWPNPSPSNPPWTLQVEFTSVIYWNHVDWVTIGLPCGGDRFQKH